MNFAFDAEQESLRETLRAFVREHWPVRAARALAGGRDPAVWRRLADELALSGIGIPESLGGQGGGFLELGIALEELGRELAGGPFLATVLGVRALRLAASPEEQRELVPPLARGERTATVAFTGETSPAARVRVEGSASAPELAGELRFALDGAESDLLLLPASTSRDEVAFYAVERGSAGLAAEPAPALDLTRRYAHLTLRGVRARPLGSGRDARAALARLRSEAAIAASAEQIGGAARCLELSVAQLKERFQFGRPIGSFQALKHRAADALMILELARSAAHWAWWVADRGGPELAEAACVAKLLGSEAYARCAEDAIHFHGGMGFTWEHDAHLYYRRARALEASFGDPRVHAAELAGLLGLSASPGV
jgi:alkylation response protein AidB-like acyl-CoA dehydrogenase